MKKRYLITFLFLLFININVAYADSFIITNNDSSKDFKLLFESLCKDRKEKEHCTAVYKAKDYQNNPITTTKEVTEGPQAFYETADITIITMFSLGVSTFEDAKKLLDERKCGDVSCWEYINNTYCKKEVKGTKASNYICDDIDTYNDLTEYNSDPKLIDDDKDKQKNFLKQFLDCESLFADEESKKLLKMVKTIINVVKLLIPILLIGLGTLDLAKAVFSGSEENMKKAQSKFIKRIIIGVCIFLIPSLLKLLLTIADSIWGNISTDFCGLL